MREKINEEFGRLIERMRKNQRLSRQKVSKNAALHDNYLYKIERKGVIPRRLLLIRLLHALNAAPAEFTRLLEMVGEDPSDSVGEVAETSIPALAPSKIRGADLNSDYWSRVTEYLRTLWGRSVDEVNTLERDLFRIVSQVGRWWENAQHIGGIPRHGPEHHLEMLRVLCQSFRAELRSLSMDELRILLASIWLHDIGLALAERRSDANDVKRLDEYDQLLGPFLDDHNGELGLPDNEKRAVWNVCRHHRNTTNLDELAIDQRAKALIALLRLSDVMSPAPGRVVKHDLAASVPLPHDISSDLHRNLFVTRVHRDERSAALVAHIMSNPSWGELKLQLLSSRIVRSIQATLDRLVVTIVGELRTTLFFASFQWIPVPPDADAEHLEKVLDELGTERSPNAARVFDSLIATLEQRLGGGEFSDAAVAVRRALQHFIMLRPFHAQIRNIADRVTEILDDKARAPEAALQDMKEAVGEWKERQRKACEEIAARGKKTFREPTRFVLFGYSNSVIRVLFELEPHVRQQSIVYVCECRNKSLYHDYRNSVDYCDGVEYAQRLRAHYEQVRIISDVSVSYYLRSLSPSGHEEKRKTAVLFGADGIDHSADVSGTIGTTTIAAAAKEFKTDVYVVAETGKIRELEWPAECERENEWLTTDPRVIAALRKGGIKTEKPWNEHVPASLITKFITEDGVLTAEAFKRKYTKA